MTIESYDNLNYLCEIFLIAGTEKLLTFTLYLEESLVNPINIAGATITWLLSPYGEFNTTTLQKAVTITDAANGIFTVTLVPSDTVSLSGKYIQQIIIVESGGDTYRPGQGVILILPAIQ